MTTAEFLNNVEKKLKQYFATDQSNQDDYQIVQVWYCKTIQNHKGLFIVKNKYGAILPYFIECTYNGDLKELYVDYYSKVSKYIFKF